MIKEELYQKKFQILGPWFVQILSSIKKELKNDHLRKDYLFVQKYFTKNSVDKLSVENLAEAYSIELTGGNEQIGEMIASRWVVKNGEIYQFFADALGRINPKFNEIEILTEEQGKNLMRQAVLEFGGISTYIFSILNSVKFDDTLFEELRQTAEVELKNEKIESETQDGEVLSVEVLKVKHAQEVLKLTDKYEKRIAGLCKKYTQDIEGLKKQIAQLQRKMGGIS